MLLKDRKGKGKGSRPSNPKEMPIGRAAKHDDTNNKYHTHTMK